MEDSLVTRKEEDLPYPFRKYIIYQKALYDNFVTNGGALFLNSSCVHATMVAGFILNKAVKDCKDVDILCGKFTLFRDNCRGFIDKVKNNLSEDYPFLRNNEIFKKFDPYGDLIEALKCLFQKNLKMNVVVTNSISDIGNDSNWELFSKYINSGQLNFRKCESDLNLNHFMVSGSAFRLERSDESKKAICSFNSSEEAEVLKKAFDNIYKNSRNLPLENGVF